MFVESLNADYRPDPFTFTFISVIRNEAGKAELGLNITSPTGQPVQYNIVPTRLGDRVTYTPTEPGPYQIYITYGGLEVPGKEIVLVLSTGIL